MKKVLIPTKLDTVAADMLKEHGGYTVIQDAKTPLMELVAAHPDAYAMFVRSEKVTPEVMSAIPGLKVVIRAGAGFDNIDCKDARKRGIDVMNTPGANANGVAEEVIALMMADARHIIAADASTREGKWEKSKFMGREIAEKTVGIVGLGNIGRLVAKRLAGFDCKILGFDPLVPAEKAAQLGIQSTDMDTIFKSCDYISLHIPENNETRGSINERLFALMKSGATLVNCARAGIIDEDALRAAKAEKGIRYLNDVYAKDAEGLKSITDVADIMMPHLGASTYEANETAARRASQQLIDFDDKGISSYVVNRDIPADLDPSYCELASTLGTLARGMLGKGVSINRIETSFYGSLAPFDRWLMLSLLSGIWQDIDRGSDYKLALQWMQDNQVQYINREADPAKTYKNSMTVDLYAVNDKSEVRKISVRGTVSEGQKMVARIGEFNRLYWVPTSNTLFFEYKDRPGVIGTIGQMLAQAGINIEDMRNPHSTETDVSMAILNVNAAVPEAIIESIAAEINATSVCAITFL